VWSAKVTQWEPARNDTSQSRFSVLHSPSSTPYPKIDSSERQLTGKQTQTHRPPAHRNASAHGQGSQHRAQPGCNKSQQTTTMSLQVWGERKDPCGLPGHLQAPPCPPLSVLFRHMKWWLMVSAQGQVEKWQGSHLCREMLVHFGDCLLQWTTQPKFLTTDTPQ
jgi:hypothetical protein